MNWYDVIEPIVDERVARDPMYGSMLSQYATRMKSGFYTQNDPDYITSMFQQWGYTGYSNYDAYCFASIHCGIGSGQIGIVDVHVGFTPFRDSQADDNNKALQNIALPFHANFVGGYGGDEDGFLSWNEPIQLNVFSAIDNTVSLQWVDRGNAPFEVGYQKSTKTLMQLSMQPQKLARWAYDSKWIRLFVVLDRSFADIDDHA